MHLMCSLCVKQSGPQTIWARLADVWRNGAWAPFPTLAAMKTEIDNFITEVKTVLGAGHSLDSLYADRHQKRNESFQDYAEEKLKPYLSTGERLILLRMTVRF